MGWKGQKFSHLKDLEAREIVRCSCLSTAPTKTSVLTSIGRNSADRNINRNAVSRYFALPWEIIFKNSLSEETDRDSDEFELDGSYFGARKIEGKRKIYENILDIISLCDSKWPPTLAKLRQWRK
ncbi:MAG: hypothetical protein LBB24_01085 [Rickettsiales bacterium]|jgi:hypothetical protein|nr:hypothetical protein [Rickettsiales bacterium]